MQTGLVNLSTLLQLEREARRVVEEEKLRFLMVNDSYRLVRYRQAILWRTGADGRRTPVTASGLAQIERDAPFVQWLTRILNLPVHRVGEAMLQPSGDELPEELRAGWQEWTPGSVLLCPLTTPKRGELGGLWITRTEPWPEEEAALLGLLLDAYAHAWAGLLPAKPRWRERRLFRRTLPPLLLAGALLAGILVPVRLSVLAPAQIAPLDPLVVAAPVEGVIREMAVEPHANVRQGDLLFRLDDTLLRSRLDIARKEQGVAEAEYLQASRKAFSDEKSKAETALLGARRDLKAAEAEYTAALLERIQVRAPADGIAIFNDRNDWIGHPVAVGQKVLTLADPNRAQLEIQLPVADAINLAPGAEVRLFLNTDPARPLEARLTRAAYEAEPTPDGILAFRLEARLEGDAPPPRIGLRGTAKLYGAEVSLGYYLLRRPIAALRALIGW